MKKFNKNKKNRVLFKHIAVRSDTKRRFDSLLVYVTNLEKPNPSQNDLLLEMIDLFEKTKKREIKDEKGGL